MKDHTENTVLDRRSIGPEKEVVMMRTDTTLETHDGESIEGKPTYQVSILDSGNPDMLGRPSAEQLFHGKDEFAAGITFENQLPDYVSICRASFLVAVKPVSGNRTWFTTAVQMKSHESLHDVTVRNRVQDKIADSAYVEDNSVDFIAPLHTFPEIREELEYFTVEVREDGNMYFTADKVQRQRLRGAVKARSTADNTDTDVWNELIMPVICNSSLMQVPEGMVALTSDPFMLSDEVDYTEDPYDPVFVGRVFSYRSYQIVEPLEQLMDTGSVVFDSFE